MPREGTQRISQKLIGQAAPSLPSPCWAPQQVGLGARSRSVGMCAHCAFLLRSGHCEGEGRTFQCPPSYFPSR